MTYYTTLNRIREHSPCCGGWKHLLHSLGKTASDDEPLPVVTVLDSNGLEHAIWCLRACEGVDRDARLFAVWCARQVQRLMVDARSIAAIDISERFAVREASSKELTRAADEALAVAVSMPGSAAGSAAWAAAMVASSFAVRDAVGAVAWDAMRAAMLEAGEASAGHAAVASQAAEFRRRFGKECK